MFEVFPQAPQPIAGSSATRGITAPNPMAPQKLPPDPMPYNPNVPMVNHNGQMIPLSQYYQMMQGANLNPAFWAAMDQMYGTGYRTPQAPPPPPMTYQPPEVGFRGGMMPGATSGNEQMGPTGGPMDLRRGNTAPPMDPFRNFNQNPAVSGNEQMGPPPMGRGAPPGPSMPNMQQGRWNPRFMGGRHLPVRRTLHNINTNSQELPLMMGIMSAAGIDPQSAMGEFKSFLPRGGRLPATVF